MIDLRLFYYLIEYEHEKSTAEHRAFLGPLLRKYKQTIRLFVNWNPCLVWSKICMYSSLNFSRELGSIRCIFDPIFVKSKSV